MHELSELEKATLKSLAEEVDYSLSGHASTEDITRNFPKYLRGNVKKCLGNIRTKKLCNRVGGKRNTRWRLSREGLNVAKQF